MKNFEHWDALQKAENLEEFSINREGLLWLKIKSILRKEYLNKYLSFSKQTLNSTKVQDSFRELFSQMLTDLENSHRSLDNFIQTISQKQIKEIDINQLVSELYKLQHFDWGGDYQNSLDKYLISRYIKVKNPSYDNLQSKLDGEISGAVRGYLFNSWYNYWSSVLLENIFKSHKNVLPTVGQIKSVDFFINDVPFDLKVTYMPAEYIKQQRKEKGWPVELTYLKQKAKEAQISFDKNASTSELFYEITEKMKDKGDEFCIGILSELKKQNTSILKDAQKEPKQLAKWLYEHQGEMRFGAENRIFLVLVDSEDMNNSWKLKRNISLLKPQIEGYLNDFPKRNIQDLKLEFEYNGKTTKFTTYSDVIFIVK